MKKSFTKYAVAVGTAVATTMLATVPAFADGGSPYSPYSPYAPHVPVDTSFISDGLIVAGIAVYLLGTGFLLSGKGLQKLLK